MIIINSPGIDYLKLSLQGQADKRITSFFGNLGHLKKDRKIMQYVGQECDGVFLGHGEIDGREWGLFDCPGSEADTYTEIFHKMELGENCICKRLDWQLTLDRPANYDAFEFRHCLKASNKRKIGIQGVEEDGITVSIGARISGKYIRIYEKDVEFEGVRRRMLRFEVEYSKAMAVQAWHGNPLNRTGILKQELLDIGVGNYSMSVLAPFLEVLNSEKAYKVMRVKPVSNTKKWFTETVAPALIKLIFSHDTMDNLFADEWIADMYSKNIEEREQWNYGD